jgi:hypothetical protein
MKKFASLFLLVLSFTICYGQSITDIAFKTDTTSTPKLYRVNSSFIYQTPHKSMRLILILGPWKVPLI